MWKQDADGDWGLWSGGKKIAEVFVDKDDGDYIWWSDYVGDADGHIYRFDIDDGVVATLADGRVAAEAAWAGFRERAAKRVAEIEAVLGAAGGWVESGAAPGLVWEVRSDGVLIGQVFLCSGDGSYVWWAGGLPCYKKRDGACETLDGAKAAVDSALAEMLADEREFLASVDGLMAGAGLVPAGVKV